MVCILFMLCLFIYLFDCWFIYYFDIHLFILVLEEKSLLPYNVLQVFLVLGVGLNKWNAETNQRIIKRYLYLILQSILLSSVPRYCVPNICALFTTFIEKILITTISNFINCLHQTSFSFKQNLHLYTGTSSFIQPNILIYIKLHLYIRFSR